MITCNRIGIGHGGEFAGESLVVSSTGEIIKKLGSTQEIVEVNIDLRNIKKSKKDYRYINLI